MDWLLFAACADEDPELFFPITHGGPAVAQTERAKAVCAGCPVRDECLAWALEAGMDYGIFGGRTADERRAIPPAARLALTS